MDLPPDLSFLYDFQVLFYSCFMILSEIHAMVLPGTGKEKRESPGVQGTPGLSWYEFI